MKEGRCLHDPEFMNEAEICCMCEEDGSVKRTFVYFSPWNGGPH